MSSIALEDASAILEQLHYFVSFARGAWAGVVLPTGIDVTGATMWREYGIRLVDSWGPRLSWADRQNYHDLKSVYAGFARLWSVEYWRRVLRRALYWYLRSNDSAAGLDGGIILTQAALEYLAWSYSVEHSRTLSKKAFKKLPASDRLRLLLTAVGVQLEIPASLPELVALGQGWDGPRAFTEIRNDLVHPVRRQSRFGGDRLPYFAAWTLGQWYLELTLLRLIGYEGAYGDRTLTRRQIGVVSDVPWRGFGPIVQT